MVVGRPRQFRKPTEYLYYRIRDITGKFAPPVIKRALNEGFAVGEKTAYSEWWASGTRGLEEVKAYFARPGSAEECASHLVQIARVAEPLVDSLLGAASQQ